MNQLSGKTLRGMIAVMAMAGICFLAGNGMAVMVSAVTSQKQNAGQPLREANWGLSFQEEGKAPVGNETAEALKEKDAYYRGTDNSNRIYITFDAGYENGNMEQILAALKKHHVTATFFVVGNFLNNNQELVKKMAAEGHYIANHSYSHPDMSGMDRMAFQGEMKKLEDTYREITGEELAKFYRPPMGKYSENSLTFAKEMGYKTIFWSLAYVDWYQDRQPTREEAFGKLLKRIHPGAIVLLHSTSATNAQILDELLGKWEEMGYTFGDLAELS